MHRVRPAGDPDADRMLGVERAIYMRSHPVGITGTVFAERAVIAALVGLSRRYFERAGTKQSL